MSDTQPVAAADRAQTHHYTLHYPAHPARAGDPHYADFDHYHRKWRPVARCVEGVRLGFDTCRDAQGNPAAPPDGPVDTSDPMHPTGKGPQPGLELHHSHIEFAILNSVDLALLELDYPGISSADAVGAWIESAANLIWVCAYHHRGHPGHHVASKSDWEGEQYVRGLIS
ncbi:MAG: hypothetical protein ACYDA6_00045 [Solirubrobacteraceae bacterium]